MQIYRLHVAVGYEWVMPVHDEENEVFFTLDGTSRTDRWQPVLMERITDDGRGHPRKPSDFPWLGGYAPVLRRRAVDAMRDFLAPYGELLPLACADAELYVLNVTRVIDAVDQERSTLVRSPVNGSIMLIKRYVLRPELIDGAHVFKIPQMPRAGIVYVDEDFVALVQKLNLTGLEFELLWEAPRR